MASRKRKAFADGDDQASVSLQSAGYVRDGLLTFLVQADRIARQCWKKADGVALLRHDLQHDLLDNIFTNSSFRFTAPTYTDSSLALFPTDRTWSFAELYLDALSNSTKANKNLKDKMGESTEFAVSFAKLCLLINVGRINTTLAFYAELKTNLRTYHPIPSMQLHEFTKKNLQDAPRMKAQLKGCLSPKEIESGAPERIAELIRRTIQFGWRPPASVVPCIFLMFQEHHRMTQKYFDDDFTLHDLFASPIDRQTAIPSGERAQVFLWLLHRFMETPELVAQDFAAGDGKLPAEHRVPLTRQDCTLENIDSPEEWQFAIKMKEAREAILGKHSLDEGLPASRNKAKLSLNGEANTPGPESIASYSPVTTPLLPPCEEPMQRAPSSQSQDSLAPPLPAAAPIVTPATPHLALPEDTKLTNYKEEETASLPHKERFFVMKRKRPVSDLGDLSPLHRTIAPRELLGEWLQATHLADTGMKDREDGLLQGGAFSSDYVLGLNRRRRLAAAQAI